MLMVSRLITPHLPTYSSWWLEHAFYYMLFFHHLGMSSSQVMNSYFSRGVGDAPPTSISVSIVSCSGGDYFVWLWGISDDPRWLRISGGRRSRRYVLSSGEGAILSVWGIQMPVIYPLFESIWWGAGWSYLQLLRLFQASNMLCKLFCQQHVGMLSNYILHVYHMLSYIQLQS